MSKTLLIMAGGTGGHIFPGLAVADAMRDAGWRVVWMGCPDSMESRLVPPRGYEMALMRFPPLRGKGLWRKLMLPFNLLRGFYQAWKLLDRLDPDVVLGMGGYVTFPGGMMAVLRGIPLVLHEQNSIPGLANRMLAGISDRILTGFPNVLVRRKKSSWSGNPVRPEITAIRPPEERFDGRTGKLRILVLGGSLGAQALNETMPKALALIAAEERPQVLHQAGEKHIESVKAAYTAAGVEAALVPFIDDMAGAYAWADLVICRSGALTVSELAAVGIASLLVPFPHAVDDHQTSNARFLSSAGAAMLLPQEQLTPERLAALNTIPRSQLLQMAAQARARAKPEAAAEVARVCMESAD